MAIVDIVIIAVYLSALFFWAIYVGLGETGEDFLVFSRRAPFVLVLFSVISTWVGVGTTVATASSGYDKGISLGLTACCGGIFGALGAAWFAPRLKDFGDQFKAHTIGDFFVIRYSRGGRLAASALILIIYLLLTAGQLVGLAALLSVWTGATFTVLIVFAALSTIFYTAFAGIKSDFYTDVVHFIIMSVVLFFVLLPLTLRDVGGLSALRELPRSYFDPFAYGGVAFFAAGLVFGGGSVFVTMELWQRVYASSTGRSARAALGISIAGIILFYAVSTVLGMAARLLLPDLPDRNLALFSLMEGRLPAGLLGLGIAGFIAIFLSTLNSTLMVSSATLAKDFLIGLPLSGSRDRRLLVLGRISTFASGLLALGIAVAVPDLVALSVNGMFMLLVLLPAIAGGFFWKGATATGAWLSIVSGTLVTVCFIPFSPDTAFVPGFLASGLVFIIGSIFSSHSHEENAAVVSRWRGQADSTTNH